MSLAAALGRSIRAATAPGRVGADATYTTAAGASAPIRIVPLTGNGRQVSDNAGEYRLREQEIYVPSSGVGSVAWPDVRDSVTLNGQVWDIVAIVPDGLAGNKLALERRELITLARRA